MVTTRNKDVIPADDLPFPWLQTQGENFRHLIKLGKGLDPLHTQTMSWQKGIQLRFLHILFYKAVPDLSRAEQNFLIK